MKHAHPNNSIHEESDRIGRGARRPDDDSDPRIVIRGESISTSPPSRIVTVRNSKSFIDFLGFTFFSDQPADEEFPLKDALTDIFNIPAFDWVRTKSGWQGYENRIKLDCYGLVAFGGLSQKQTIHVELSGTGCKQVEDWVLVHDWFETTDSRITRADLAHDDFEGEIANIANAIKWYEDGLFNSNGRPPARSIHYDFGSGDGTTFNIGKRGNDRYTRIYEKGKQLGDPKSPWCRAEVECKAHSKIIPNEIFLCPDDYLAGAFKAFQYLSTEQSKFLTIAKDREISLERVTKQGKSAYGKLVNLLCFLYENDYEKVINSLRRPGIPKSLEPQYKQLLIDTGIEP
ncbi:MAG: replication initiation factor domain-containing protein [Gammaproteobacteria bacterium]|nr:replication initiation factor domain-containing protein [Gammaproteobacteria bacterium]